MVAVDLIGAAAVSAAGPDLAATFEAILARRTAIATDPALVAAGLKSALVARLPAQDAPPGTEPALPREHRVLLAVLDAALADAGLARADLGGLRVGLVAGTSSGAMAELTRALRGHPRAAREGTYFAPAALAADALGLAGPVHTVSSACASGSLALALAADLVLSGEVDLALAAGYDLWSDFVHAGFDALGALSARPPAPFRGDRAGLVLGEAAAAAVLAPEGARRGRVRGRLLGAGLSGDARHITAPDAEGGGVARAIATALAEAGLSAADVDLISAHGTGTLHNDAMESRALVRALGSALPGLPVHTVKPIVGHTLGAAGLLEALVALEALARGLAPPTLTSDVPDPDCAVLHVPTAGPVPLSRARTALKLSSGFGGSNAVLVLSCA